MSKVSMGVRNRALHDGSRNGEQGPNPSDRRNGKGEPGVRLRVVAAPGGVAFVGDSPPPTGSNPR
jgi:hypothetical protein